MGLIALTLESLDLVLDAIRRNLVPLPMVVPESRGAERGGSGGDL